MRGEDLGMSDQQFDDEIDLGELFLTILGEWRIVASAFIGAVLFSAVYAFAIAPTQYRAEASLRGISQAYCPPASVCEITLNEAIAGAAALVSTPKGFASLDAALNLSADDDFAGQGEFAQEGSRRSFFGSVDIEADGATAVVLVTHSSDLRAVELANAIAEFVASEVALSASENYEALKSSLRLRLATLPAPRAVMAQSDALIQLERSTIEAQLQSLEQHVAAGLSVAVIDLPASLPLELVAPNRSLIVALGGVLGVFLGVGAAIVFSMRLGKLHSVRAVAVAFGGGDAVVGQRKDVVAGAGRIFWQDVRVSFGEFDGGTVLMTGFAPDEVILRSANGLASEFARSGIPVSIIDMGARAHSGATVGEVGGGVSVIDKGTGIPTYRCEPSQMDEVMAKLSKDGGVVIMLPPSPDSDLPSVRQAIAMSKGRVFLVNRGEITRHDVGRLLLAERGVAGRRVLAIT